MTVFESLLKKLVERAKSDFSGVKPDDTYTNLLCREVLSSYGMTILALENGVDLESRTLYSDLCKEYIKPEDASGMVELVGYIVKIVNGRDGSKLMRVRGHGDDNGDGCMVTCYFSSRYPFSKFVEGEHVVVTGKASYVGDIWSVAKEPLSNSNIVMEVKSMNKFDDIYLLQPFRYDKDN